MSWGVTFAKPCHVYSAVVRPASSVVWQTGTGPLRTNIFQIHEIAKCQSSETDIFFSQEKTDYQPFLITDITFIGLFQAREQIPLPHLQKFRPSIISRLKFGCQCVLYITARSAWIFWVLMIEVLEFEDFRGQGDVFGGH